jgi:polar amino acid transport system substrate-binding protein
MSAVLQSVDAAVLRDLAPNGVLRAAINFGNSVLAQRDAATGEARGVSVDLAIELARRIGAVPHLVPFDAAGKVVDAVSQGAWDVAFLAVDPTRSAEIRFTMPYVLIEGAYMVRDDSALQSAHDVDRPGISVALGAGSAYDLYLTRSLKHAGIERRATASEAFDLLVGGAADVAAGVHQVVERYARCQGGLRLLEPNFMTIRQAMGTPAACESGARYLADFIDEMRASGFVADALARSGQRDAVVAPAGAA